MGESGQRGESCATEKTGTVQESEPPGRSSSHIVDHVSIRQLFSDSLDTRLQALERIVRCGERAAVVLAELLCKTPARSGHYPVIAEALERIGKPSVPPLMAVLSRMSAPRRGDDIYLLEEAAQILGHLADRRAVPALVRALELLQDAVQRAPNETVAALGLAAKIRVHRALADLGSREGATDLLRMLGGGRRRVREEVIDLSAIVGDQRFLPALVRLHGMEQTSSEWRARLTRLAIREIARRERVERGHPIFLSLDAAGHAFLEKLLPKAKGGHGGGGTTRAGARERDRHLRSA